MQRTVKIISLVAAMAVAAACGGGASPSSPSAPDLDINAATPPKAEIDVTMGLDAVFGPSADPSYVSYVRFTAAMTERAGLGANLDFVRGEFFKDDVLMERFEVTASRIIEETGSNRLEAGSERSVTVMLRYSAPADLIRTTFHFTDDQGNEHHLVGNVGPGATATAASLSEGPRL
jgi:hypothetical protein